MLASGHTPPVTHGLWYAVRGCLTSCGGRLLTRDAIVVVHPAERLQECDRFGGG